MCCCGENVFDHWRLMLSFLQLIQKLSPELRVIVLSYCLLGSILSIHQTKSMVCHKAEAVTPIVGVSKRLLKLSGKNLDKIVGEKE